MASQPPSASTPTTPSEGMAVSAGLYQAVSLIMRSRDANSRELASSSRSCSCSSCPKPLTTRTPPMASSTIPATSPDCCCASQLAGNSLRRDASAIIHRAGATTTVTMVSTGESTTMMPRDDDEQRQVPERDRHHGQQALHHVQVGDGPADELPGVDLVLAGAIQPGQRVEELGPQVMLDVEGNPAPVVAAQVDAGEVDRRRDQQQDRERPDRLPVRDDDVVDDPPLDQRYRGRGHGGQQGAAQRDDHVPAVAPAVGRQPSQPPAGLSRPSRSLPVRRAPRPP